jgi:NADH-quinone oxidoreductase E subunit
MDRIFRRLARSRGKGPMSLEFSFDSKKKIAALCERYPTKRPVILAALHLAQKEFGYLSDDALQLVGRELDLPYAHVYGVATFYTMFRREPGGKTTIRVCTNISCMLRGGYDVLEAFERKLGVKKGQSTKDFSLVEEECIAACANAPAVLCGTQYFLDVTPEQVDNIIRTLLAKPQPESEVV